MEEKSLNIQEEVLDEIADFLEDVENSDETYKKNINERMLTIEELSIIENQHWFYLYRYKILRLLIEKFIEKNTNQEILDIGIGSGKLSLILEDFGNVTRIDKSKKVVQFVKDKYDLDVILSNIPWIDQSNEIYLKKMDYILMMNTLEYIKNDTWTLNLLKNILNEDGKLLLSVPANKIMYSNQDKINNVIKRYDKKEIIDMLNDNGFEIEYFTYYNSFVGKYTLIETIYDKVMEENDYNRLFLNSIPDNNEELYKNASMDFLNIMDKPLPYGTEMFIVCKHKKEKTNTNKFKLIDFVKNKINNKKI